MTRKQEVTRTGRTGPPKPRSPRSRPLGLGLRWLGLELLAVVALAVPLAPCPAASAATTATVARNAVYMERIINRASQRCFEVDRWSQGANGARVQLWDCLDAANLNQNWYATPTSTPGIYKIHTRYNGRCLDADRWSLGRDGTKVQLWDCLADSQTNQNWFLSATREPGVYKIGNQANGRCLDADSTSIFGNGTRMQLWTCLGDGQLNQSWFFTL